MMFKGEKRNSVFYYPWSYCKGSYKTAKQNKTKQKNAARFLRKKLLECNWSGSHFYFQQ